MRLHRSLRPAILVAAGALLAVSAAAPAVAHAEEGVITVIARDYAFEGLPTSVPAGTELGMTNQGAEFHELVVVRINDDVTESLEELLALPDEEALTKVTLLGMPLLADAGATAEGTLTLEQEGRYAALCFIPQGTAGHIELPDPEAPPESQGMPEGIGDGPPHALLGMVQEFTVTAPGTTPGPLPEAPAEGRVIELEMNAALQILQDGQQVKELNVAVGETITFRVTNTAGYDHNFIIGPESALMANQVEGLPGTPVYTEGTREFTWVVPENAAELKFGCTVPGHYTLMNGSFVVGG
jgi:plastocyanin